MAFDEDGARTSNPYGLDPGLGQGASPLAKNGPCFPYVFSYVGWTAKNWTLLEIPPRGKLTGQGEAFMSYVLSRYPSP